MLAPIDFHGAISDAFTPYMSSYVELERKRTDDLIVKIEKEEKWSHPEESKARDRYGGSDDLFLYIKNSINQCNKLNRNEILFNLYLEYRRGLQMYCETLDRHLSKREQLSEKELVMTAYIVNTAEYCLAAGTFVTWADQTSVPIESTPNDRATRVLAYDPVQDGCMVKETEGRFRLNQGMKECVELVLEDGRKLVCTQDHRVRTRRGDVKVEDLKDDDRVIVTVEGPQVEMELAAWALEYDLVNYGVTTHVELKMNTRDGYYRALAFARVLGYLTTDGTVCGANADSVLYMGHKMDALSMREDLALVLGCTVTDINIISPNTHAAVDPATRNTFNIWVPRRLARVMVKYGCPVGKKLGQGVGIPPIILKADTPRPFIREFLGAMFGGDGSAPIVEKQTLSSASWSSIVFHTSVLSQDRAAATTVFEKELKPLMKMFGVDGVVRDRECGSDLSTDDTWQILFVCSAPSTLAFAKGIGFRHCVHKIVRLSVAASWYRAVEARRQQRVRLVDAVRQVREAGPKDRGGRSKLTWQDTVDSVLACMKHEEVELSGVVPGEASVRGYLRGERDPADSGNTFYSVQEFVDAIGASAFFNPGKATMGSSRRVYAVPRHLTALPVWHLGVAGVRPVGPRPTFDLTLPSPHLFVADGIVVHNCIDTVPQLEQSIRGIIDAAYKERIDLNGAVEQYTALTTKAVQVMVSSTANTLNKTLTAMSKNNWESWQSVGDESQYVVELIRTLKHDLPVIASHLSPRYLKLFFAHNWPATSSHAMWTLSTAPSVSERWALSSCHSMHTRSRLFCCSCPHWATTWRTTARAAWRHGSARRPSLRRATSSSSRQR